MHGFARDCNCSAHHIMASIVSELTLALSLLLHFHRVLSALQAYLQNLLMLLHMHEPSLSQSTASLQHTLTPDCEGTGPWDGPCAEPCAGPCTGPCVGPDPLDGMKGGAPGLKPLGPPCMGGRCMCGPCLHTQGYHYGRSKRYLRNKFSYETGMHSQGAYRQRCATCLCRQELSDQPVGRERGEQGGKGGVGRWGGMQNCRSVNEVQHVAVSAGG